LDLDVSVIVPGHGPVTDKLGVHRVRDYLTYVISEGTKRFEEGLDLDAAIRSLYQGRFSLLPEHSRVAQNVVSVYQSLSSHPTLPDGRLRTHGGPLMRWVTYAGSGETDRVGLIRADTIHGVEPGVGVNLLMHCGEPTVASFSTVWQWYSAVLVRDEDDVEMAPRP
jgi:hypothetical protein